MYPFIPVAENVSCPNCGNPEYKGKPNEVCDNCGFKNIEAKKVEECVLVFCEGCGATFTNGCTKHEVSMQKVVKL